jgi:hypothetical protein
MVQMVYFTFLNRGNGRNLFLKFAVSLSPNLTNFRWSNHVHQQRTIRPSALRSMLDERIGNFPPFDNSSVGHCIIVTVSLFRAESLHGIDPRGSPRGERAGQYCYQQQRAYGSYGRKAEAGTVTEPILPELPSNTITRTELNFDLTSTSCW